MSIVPRINRPCPYKARLHEVMDGDRCRMCRRTVVNLDGLSAAERRALVAGCRDELCVRYTLPAAAAAALLATAPLAAAPNPPDPKSSAKVESTGEIIVGGIPPVPDWYAPAVLVEPPADVSPEPGVSASPEDPRSSR